MVRPVFQPSRRALPSTAPWLQVTMLAVLNEGLMLALAWILCVLERILVRASVLQAIVAARLEVDRGFNLSHSKLAH
jgi:hypothetical protein